MSLTQELKQKISQWEAGDVDEENKAQIQGLLQKENWAELSDCFSAMLEFGTAGLRGLIGPGPNRMNAAVVRKTSLGLLKTLKEKNKESRGVVVGFDGRQKSEDFAYIAAGTLLAHGIPVYFFTKCTPTPLVAYGVLQKKASAGIVITASHNPPEYNGYKVFWENGAQIIPPIDGQIKGHIEKTPPANQIPCLTPSEISSHKLLESADFLVESYKKTISQLGLSTPIDLATQITVAYTPMHGVGAQILEEVFHSNGFDKIHTVKEQAQPDGRFPTVTFPNPEEKGAMDLVLALGEKVKADLVLANDPDADRLAAAVRNEKDTFTMLTGNEIGIILGHHMLDLAGSNAANSLVVNSIVSTSLLGRIAQKKGAKHRDTLTGFKWIANTAMKVEQENKCNFVFGFEEALGSTVGTVVRDKDGISAALVFSKLAANLKKEGKSIWSWLTDIYREFGLYQTRQRSLTLKGQAGLQKIQSIMENTRKKTPKTIGPYTIESYMDIQSSYIQDAQGKKTSLDLPSSNVVIFGLSSNGRVILRPSGTEPKLKIYYEVCFPMREDMTIEAAKKEADSIIDMLDLSVQKCFIN